MMTDRQNLAVLFKGVEATMESVKRINAIYDPIVALHFNSLNVLRPGENKISEILAFFLDPVKPHGQGDVFLRLFISMIGLTERIGPWGKVSVKTEHVTDAGRRIDLFINFDGGRFALAVENKLWAVDQKEQVLDYTKYLEAENQDFMLLYLTPSGKLPTEISISEMECQRLNNEGKFMLLKYAPQVVNIIAEWQRHCRAERVRSFLKDFEQYLKQIISGDSFMSEHTLIADHIIESPEMAKNVEVAFGVWEAIPDLKVKLLNMLREQLALAAKQLDLELEYSLTLDEPHSRFAFAIRNSSLRIVFQFDQKDLKYLFYGVTGATAEFREKYQPRILGTLKRAKGDQEWFFWEEFRDIWSWQKEHFVQIADGRMSKIIMGKTNDILKILRSFDDNP